MGAQFSDPSCPELIKRAILRLFSNYLSELKAITVFGDGAADEDTSFTPKHYEIVCTFVQTSLGSIFGVMRTAFT